MTDRDHQPGNPWGDASPEVIAQVADSRDREVGLMGIRACRETLARARPPKARRFGDVPVSVEAS